MTPRWISSGLVAAWVAALVEVVAAQSRDTLETKVTVTEGEIVFKWGDKHPWDAVLIANGASLFAEYRTANGPGVECVQPGNAFVAAATAPFPAGRGMVPAGGRFPVAGNAAGGCYAGNAVFRKDDRTIYFRLPERLTAEPIGPVCMQLRLPDGRVLPVRQASRAGGDTVWFQVEEWTKQMASVTGRARLEDRRRELQAAMATQSREIGEQDVSNREKGWTSPEACAAQKGGTVEVVRSNRPVAPPNQQDATARQVCILRVANGKGGRVMEPGLILRFLNPVPSERAAPWIRLRGAQVKQFIDDWETYAPRIPEYRARYRELPHFGAYDDVIPIQSLAIDALIKIVTAEKQQRPVDAKDVFGFAGATVEAYNRCVTDGTEQVALNYQQAQQLAATVETLPERLRQQAVQACQQGVGRLASMRTRLAGFEQELATVERERSMLATPTAPIRIRPRELNTVSCTP